MIIDAQLHEPSVSLEWKDADQAARRDVMSEALLDYLDAVGVDGAILNPRDDPEWGAQLAARFPKRIGYVFRAPSIAEEPDVDERVAEAKRAPGQVGLRLVLGVPRTGEEVARFKAGVYDAMLAAMERHGVPLFVMATWNLELASEIATRHPELQVIVDHLGIPQPPTQPLDSPRFKALDDVLALARHPNLAVKLTGAAGLSEEPFPYRDLWPHLLRYVEAFSPERLLWGSDISRFDGRVGFSRRPRTEVPDSYQGKHTYAEALLYMRETDQLSASEKEAILGGTAQRLLDWPPAG